MGQPGTLGRWEILAQAAILTLAAILLFWELAEKDLWQDEAATAVLAVRMLKFGRPMAYDGVNLLTIDMQDDDDEATLNKRVKEPQADIDYYVAQGNFKADTTWKWQPWGLFAVAALSIKLLGQTTLAARLPFALMGLATVFLLFRLVRRQFGSLTMAALATLLLVCNSYWILHARQCRYYSVSSLFLVMTLMAYARWQWGGRSPVAFLAVAFCWFQMDYGTVLPVLAVVFLEALIVNRRGWLNTIVTGAILGATLLPFVFFYDLLHRGSDADGTWLSRFRHNFFNTNEYVVPIVIVAAVVYLLARHWSSIAEGERRLVTLGCAIIVAFTLWIPTVTVYSFVRYVIVAVPVGAMLTAWLLLRVVGTRRWLAGPAAAMLILTPWLSVPLRMVGHVPDWWAGSIWYRTELADVQDQVFGHQPDPNRIVIDWLKQNAKPTDEILINYEDFPLMYYLPNPIRGGIATFRVEDDARTPPAYVILRHSVDFVDWPIFNREVAHYQWQQIPLHAPDVMWGSNPDPMGDDDPREAKDLYFARRVDAGGR